MVIERKKDNKRIFEFHEALIDAIRPLLKEGIRSVLISSPIKTDYAKKLYEHVKKHHAWLIQEKAPNTAAFGVLIGPASSLYHVYRLIKTKKVIEIIGETISKETDKIIDVLEKRLNVIDAENLIFSLRSIEKLIFSRLEPEDLKPEYLLLTDKYLATSKQKNRLHRLMQVAKNKQVKVKVIDEEETNAGKRVAQFGGIVCLTKTPSL